MKNHRENGRAKMKKYFFAGILMFSVGLVSPTFGSDCKKLHVNWQSAKGFLEGEHANPIGLAIFRANWVMFLESQSPTGFRFSELPKEEQDALEMFIEPLVFQWLEENPDTTNLSADECLFQALKEPLGLKELR
jgi:hypothetical protein